MVKALRSPSGFTIIEILVVVAILGVLSSASVPFAEFTFIREKEGEFKNNLSDIRKAIGRWRRDAEKAVQKAYGLAGLRGMAEPALFPPDIGSLTKSINHSIPVPGTDPSTGLPYVPVIFYHDRYLAAIPIDPFVGRPLWTQHYAGDAQTTDYDTGITPTAPVAWGGVFDVTGTSTTITRRGFVTAIDGTNYSDW